MHSVATSLLGGQNGFRTGVGCATVIPPAVGSWPIALCKVQEAPIL